MTSRRDLDPYVVLGVRRHASPDEIARAYRRAARATHPDSAGPGAAAERFQAVSDAYELLRDPGRRAGYDRLHPFFQEGPARVAGGSARYAAPGSQHVVLGSRPSDRDELCAVRRPREVEELFAAVLSLLRGSW